MIPHLPGLEIQKDGTVLVETQDDLDRLLASPVHDLSTEMIDFVDREWLERTEEERASIAAFLNAAREQVCNEGRLPSPRTELPAIGAHVEVPAVGGKPSPDCRYGTGSVCGYQWWAPLELSDGRCTDGAWKVEVGYYEATGGWCGFPTLGQVLSPELVYVIGRSPGRPYSQMSPSEIEAMFETRRHR